MTHSPTVHDSFSLTRHYAASPQRVFHALSNPQAKAKWFGGEGHHILIRNADIRPGSTEEVKAQWPNGLVTHFKAVYFDVIPETRLVYAYEMFLNGAKISVSLATVELTAQDGGTIVRITEQGAFLDGYEDAGSPEAGTTSRKHGTGFLLDALAKALEG
jgi:uncharacterized protein YndB with AHSA1/START domain